MNITFLGAGNMGTALANTIIENEDNSVKLWSIESEVVKSINNEHENKKYLPGVKLANSITCESNLEKSVKQADIIVFSVPSHAVKEVRDKIKEHVPSHAIIVNVAKGLEKGSNKGMSEVIEEGLNNEVITVGGPCIANELSRKVPTFVVYAGTDKKILKKVKNAFETNYYQISLSSDKLGVELCSALKNIIAILAGYNDGLGHGINTKAGLITKGLKELREVSKVLGAEEKTINGLAGLGDLIVTCTSKHSRNRRFGQALARGLTQEQALKKIGQVVEGRRVVKVVYELVKKHDLHTPLIEKVHELVK